MVKRVGKYHDFVQLMYQSNRSLNTPPPRAYPGHLTSFAAREGGNLMNLVFPGAGHLITAHMGWGIWSLSSIPCYVVLSFTWRDKSWRRQALMHSQRKIPDFAAASRGWGHLVIWNEPIMGHLNSFSASGWGNLNKNFPKIQMPGGLPGGGGCLSFDLTGT